MPTLEEETVRALVRLREDLTLDMTRVKNRVLKYLATLGFCYKDGKNWTMKFRAWLRGLPLAAIMPCPFMAAPGKPVPYSTSGRFTDPRAASYSFLPSSGGRLKSPGRTRAKKISR